MNDIQVTLILFAIGWWVPFFAAFGRYKSKDEFTIVDKILLVISPIFSLVCVVGIFTNN